MKKTKKGGVKVWVLLSIVLVLVVVSAIMFGYSGNSMEEMQADIGQKAQDIVVEGVVEKVVDDGRVMVGEKLKETGEKILGEEELADGFYGVYVDVDVNEFEKVVLFFTAPWCPSCIEAENDIEIYKKEIPAGVAIVRVDFDNNIELREKYNVTKQHTFVLIDKVGEAMLQWNGDKTFNEIMNNIK